MKFAYLFGFIVLSLCVAHQTAAAVDGPVKMPPQASDSPSPFDWTGFYFGGHVGYATGSSNFAATTTGASASPLSGSVRSEEHTSELQSLRHLVCRLLLEKT